MPGGAGSQDNSGKWPSAFQSACPNKLCEPPTGHSCEEGAGQEEVRRLLSPLTARGCVCSLSHPPCDTAGGSSMGRKQEGVTASPHLLQSCTCAPPTLPPAAQLSMSRVPSSWATEPGERLKGWAGLKSTASYLMDLPLSNLTTRILYCFLFLANKKIIAQRICQPGGGNLKMPGPLLQSPLHGRYRAELTVLSLECLLRRLEGLSRSL